MIKNDLKNYIAARMGVDVSDGQVSAYVEAARMMVLSADGKHVWNNLTVKTTLALTANTANYNFPADGSDDQPISKLILVEKQGASDLPIKIYTEEEAAETDFTVELGGVILRPTSQPGQVQLVFKNTPSTSGTLDLVYRKIPGDDLDFVKSESHDVFLFACDVIIPVKGVSMGEAFAIQRGKYAMFQDRLAAAISNDYTASTEAGKTLPVQPIRDMQGVFMGFQGDRD